MITNKSFGIRGVIDPPIKDINDDFSYENGIFISIHNGVFEVGYDKENDEDSVRKIADTFIAAWSFRNFKVVVNFNQTWKPDSHKNRIISVFVNDQIFVKDRVTTTTTLKMEMSYVVKQTNDSYNFSNDIDIVRKADNDETLSLVLGYFYSEVLDEGQIMSGVHKAIEQITKHLGSGNDQLGRQLLAKLADCDKEYIDNLMTFVQKQRHSKIWLVFKKIWQSKPVFSTEECITGVKKLIQAYATYRA